MQISQKLSPNASLSIATPAPAKPSTSAVPSPFVAPSQKTTMDFLKHATRPDIEAIKGPPNQANSEAIFPSITDAIKVPRSDGEVSVISSYLDKLNRADVTRH